MDTRSPCCRHNLLHGSTGPGPGAGAGRPNEQPGEGFATCVVYSSIQHKYLLPDHLVELRAGGGGGTGDHQRNAEETWTGK